MTGQLTTNSTAATTDGVVPAGAIAIGFAAGVDCNATIDGAIVIGSGGVAAMNYPELYQGCSYGAIAYTVSAGTLYIMEVR